MDMINDSGKLSRNRVKVIKMMEFNIYDCKNLASQANYFRLGAARLKKYGKRLLDFPDVFG